MHVPLPSQETGEVNALVPSTWRLLEPHRSTKLHKGWPTILPTDAQLDKNGIKLNETPALPVIANFGGLRLEIIYFVVKRNASNIQIRIGMVSPKPYEAVNAAHVETEATMWSAQYMEACFHTPTH